MRELILNFHGIGEPHEQVSASEARYWLTLTSFASLLDRIVDRSVTLNPTISITFDDGNASDVVLALPELVKRKLNAIFFICAGRIGQKYYLDTKMIRDLINGGMQIGSHGMHHRDWRRLDAQHMKTEIVEAKLFLEDVTGCPVNTVSIPFGSYDRRVLSCLHWEKWDCVYTSDRGTAQRNAKLKPRETLDNSMISYDIIETLTAEPPTAVRAIRAFLQYYKRWR